MARAPYNPVPQVGLRESPLPTPNITTPIAAFGGAQAQATGELGQSLGQSGNEIFTRALAMQQLTNETDAKNAAAEYTIQAGQIHAQYSALQGKDAVDAYPKYQQDLEAARQKIRGALNPMAAKMYDGPSLSMMGRSVYNGAGHAATEQKNYVVGGAVGQVELAKNQAATNWNDPAAFDASVAHITAQDRLVGASKGWAPAQTQAQIEKDVGEATYKKLEAQAVADPFGARKAYETHKDLIGPYKAQTEVMIQQREASIGSRIIAQGITAGGDYFDQLHKQESAGNIFAMSPTSTAYGVNQITAGTWADIRAKHPDMALPANIKDATPAQQNLATKAFTDDNQKYLATHGVDVNNQNTYMAHFLGAAGAVKFLQGMKANPTQPAADLVDPAAVKANHNVFYNPDGSPRTAAQVYLRQTAAFAGPGTLTRDSGSDWLATAEKAARDQAIALNPDNPALADQAVARVQTQYNLVRNGAIAADRETQNDFEKMILDPKGIRSMDQIYDNPILAERYNNLPGPRQNEIRNLVVKMSKEDVPFTPARQKMFYQVKGMMDNPATRAKALDLDFSKLDLPQKQIGQLQVERQRIIGGLQTNQRLQQSISLARPYMKSLGIVAGSDDENEFIGSLSERLSEYENQHKAYPNEKEVRQMAADLSAYSGGFLGFGGAYGYEPTSEFKDEITPLYQSKYGRAPDPGALAQMYQYSLTHPHWREELK